MKQTWIKRKMRWTRETIPFPHIKITDLPDLDPQSKAVKVWDRLVNCLAWEFGDGEKWVLRGARKESYKLESALDRGIERRIDSGINQQTAEDYLLKQFKRAAHHFLESCMVPDKKDRLEWLALMQHYGAPTRLLDFTRSPYVACFFAMEEGNIEDDRAIWAINSKWLVDKSFPHIKKKLAPDKRDMKKSDLLDSNFIAQHFDAIFTKNTVPLILPVEPPRSNPRLLVQQGLFLCPSVAEKGFITNLSAFSDDVKRMQDSVCKIVINHHIRTEALSELNLMNINSASLFPDLSGFASSLGHKLEWI